MRHPASIVLDALLIGQTITLGGYRYRLVGTNLAIVGTRRIGWGPEEDVLLGAQHMTVSDFVAQAKALSQNELALIAADTVLNRMSQEHFERVYQNQPSSSR